MTKRETVRLHYPGLSLEQLVFNRLMEIAKKRKLNRRILRFPLVFSVICPIYCLNKSQAWVVLRSLRKLGWIEIVPYQGVKLCRVIRAKE